MLRRALLRALPFTAAAVAIPAVAAKPALTASERLDAAIAELQAATVAVYPGVNHWAIVRADDPAHTLPLIVAAKVSEPPVTFTGPGLYEFDVLNDEGERTIRPVAHLDHAPGVLGSFRWQHVYRGKFQGRPRVVPARCIRIIRKMEAPDQHA